MMHMQANGIDRSAFCLMTKIEAFRARGAEVEDGAFGENLVVQGFDFHHFRLEPDFVVEKLFWK